MCRSFVICNEVWVATASKEASLACRSKLSKRSINRLRVDFTSTQTSTVTESSIQQLVSLDESEVLRASLFGQRLIRYNRIWTPQVCPRTKLPRWSRLCKRSRCEEIIAVVYHPPLKNMSIQMKDFMTLYSGLVERCFMDCATDFSSAKYAQGHISKGTTTALTCSRRQAKDERNDMRKSLCRQIPCIVNTSRKQVLGIQRRTDGESQSIMYLTVIYFSINRLAASRDVSNTANRTSPRPAFPVSLQMDTAWPSPAWIHTLRALFQQASSDPP